MHTPDIYNPLVSKKKVSMQEFTDNLINNFDFSNVADTKNRSENIENKQATIHMHRSKKEKKKVVGIDLYTSEYKCSIDEFLSSFGEDLKKHSLKLSSISQRGLMVWPKNNAPISDNDLLCLRIVGTRNTSIASDKLLDIQREVSKFCMITATQILLEYSGVQGFSSPQGN